MNLKFILLSAPGPSPHRWARGCLDYADQCSRSFCLCLQNTHVWRPRWPAGPTLLRHEPGRWRYTFAARATTGGWSRLNCLTGTAENSGGFTLQIAVWQTISVKQTWVPSRFSSNDFTLSVWPFNFMSFAHVRGSHTLSTYRVTKM